jgi:hypothetical protein
VTNAAFARALGRALRRPAVLAMPAVPLRLAIGAFAEELLLGGQRVEPRAALASGFHFAYGGIDDALAAIVGRRGSLSMPAPRAGEAARLRCRLEGSTPRLDKPAARLEQMGLEPRRCRTLRVGQL